MTLGLLTGVLPWLYYKTGKNLIGRLKEGGQTTGSKRQQAFQKGLATMQIVVSVVLLIGGILLFKSYMTSSKTDLGFESENKLAFRIALSWFKYGSPEKKAAFFESSLREIESIPGVEKATLNSLLPLTDIVSTAASAHEIFIVEGQSDIQQSENPFISVQRIVPNYFDAMGIDIQKGTSFDPEQYTSHQHQVIIDRYMADKMWPGENAIGKRIMIGGNGSEIPFLTVIGVVDNVKHQSIMGVNIPSVYISFFSYPHTDAFYVVQTKESLQELESKLKEAILSIDEKQPTFEYTHLTDIVDKKNWQSKVSGALFLTIAIIGSIIAFIGLFSMMSFILILKVKELALRRVLGATDQGILKLIIKDMLKISGIGITGGILLSPILLQPLVPFLFEVSIIDITIYLMVVIALLGVSILATLLPMRNALLINPAKVLKGE
jgi:ABC-type antimicrobial peptide transport system permease subunit